MHLRFTGLCALVLSALLLAPAGAQTTPSPAPSASAPTPLPVTLPDSIPPGVAQELESIVLRLAGDLAAPFNVDKNHLRGVVSYFHGFDLQVRLPLNDFRNIHLHQGTVINPRGWTLGNGQVIDVQGHAQPDGSLDADTITLVHQ
jgi:hypothetical protein